MRVVVVGATGNIGTSVLSSLAREPRVTRIVGAARRRPDLSLPKTEFVSCDVVDDDLVPLFRGADAVIHLAWLLQPSRSPSRLEAVNVRGSQRVFNAVLAAGVPQLLVASSVGSYAPGPKDRAVNEDWPTLGIPNSLYSRHKAAVERLMDELEWERPDLKLVRIRPGLVFKLEASSEIQRLFIGGRWPRAVFRGAFIPFLPGNDRLRFQVLHSFDVGEAFRLALVKNAKGPFNLAAEPVLDPEVLSRALGKPVVKVPAVVLRRLFALSYHLRLQPAEPGWLELALNVPIMSTERARRELGWSPAHSSLAALGELLTGLRQGAGGPTLPLAAAGSREAKLLHH